MVLQLRDRISISRMSSMTYWAASFCQCIHKTHLSTLLTSRYISGCYFLVYDLCLVFAKVSCGRWLVRMWQSTNSTTFKFGKFSATSKFVRTVHLHFPVFAKLAQIYLAPPPSCVQSERIFSAAVDVYAARCGCLFPTNTDQLVLLKFNLSLLNYKYWFDITEDCTWYLQFCT